MFGSHKFGWMKHPGYNGKGGGGQQTQPSTTTTVQKADPWSGVQPYLTKAYSEGERLYSLDGPKYYPNQTYAGLDPYQALGRSMMLDYSTGGMIDDINSIRGAYGDLLKSADVSNNPFLEPAIKAATRPAFEQLNEVVMPSLRAGAMNAGQVGSSREGIAQGLATKGAMQSAIDAGTQMANTAYQQGLDSLTKAMLFGPQMLQLGMQPATSVEAYGAANQAEAQKVIDEAMSRWDFEQNLPQQKLANWMSMLESAPWNSSSSSSGVPASTSYRGSPLAGALGGGMMGYQLGGMFPMIGGPLGAVGGAILGSLFS